MNYCRDCILKQKEFPPTKCPECGQTTLYGRLSGATLLLKCTNCGFDLAGASFFAECNKDFMPQYTLSTFSAEKSQYLKAAKVFGINVVQLKKYLDSGKAVARSNLCLNEVLNLMLILQEAGLQYQVIPNPIEKYPEILCCKLR